MHLSLSNPPENTGRGQMKDKLLETRQNEECNERNVRKEHFHHLLYWWDTFAQTLLAAWFYKTLQTQVGLHISGKSAAPVLIPLYK